jgi:hypothetical protein
MVRMNDSAAGYVTVLLPFLLALSAFSAVALLDLLAYVQAGAQAQTAADTAALAAAGPNDARFGASSHERASTVAGAYGARLTRCDCGQWRAIVRVDVELPVPARALPHLGGARHVSASASATTAPSQ